MLVMQVFILYLFLMKLWLLICSCLHSTFANSVSTCVRWFCGVLRFSCLKCIICDCCGCLLNCQQAFKTADESSADATVVKDAAKAAASVSKEVKKATEKTKKLDVKSDVMFSFIPPSFVSYLMKIVIIIKSFGFFFLKSSVMFYH